MMRKFAYVMTFLLFSSHALANDSLPKRIIDMNEDSKKLDYRGNFILQQGESIKSYSILHVYSGDKEKMRITDLENTQSEIIKNGDKFICIQSKENGEKKVEQVLQGAGKNISPSKSLLAQGIRHYDIQHLGERQVAGRFCDMVKITPLKKDRLQHMFCLDKEYNLALKTETRSLDNELLESIQFISLDFNPLIKSEQFIIPNQSSNYNLSTADSLTEDHAPLSVQVNWLPDGFRQVTSRQYEKANGVLVMRYIFSDGFSSFSLFTESSDKQIKPMTRHVGSTTIISRAVQAEDNSFKKVTLTGELPSNILDKVSQNIFAQ